MEFQFLSRNSVRWDRGGAGHTRRTRAPVSIPQSEFCPLGLVSSEVGYAIIDTVSIPQSEFCPLGHWVPEDVSYEMLASFNSSVGILSVGTDG